MRKTWDNLKKERMPDLETHPEKYHIYFLEIVHIELGCQIRIAREKMGLSRAELAEKLNYYLFDMEIDEQYIKILEAGFSIEAGLPSLSLEFIQICAIILKTPVTLIFSSNELDALEEMSKTTSTQ